jgi:hypothetical protein
MKRLLNNNTSTDDMSKNDIIETILFIIEQILNYTSKLNQSTPSIFDKKEKDEINDKSELTTDSTDPNSEEIENNAKYDKFSLAQYLYYWTDKLNLNENLLLLMTMNLDKILESQKIILSEKNVENVLYTCMIITQKFYEDDSFSDKDYSKLKKVDIDELINMQIELLNLIDYSLLIDEADLSRYKKRMNQICQKNMLHLLNS